MRNILDRKSQRYQVPFWFLIGTWYLCVGAPVDILAADAGEAIQELGKVISSKVSETAKPLFDPNQVQEKTHPADPYLDKLRKTQSKFNQKQMDRRKDFYDKMRSKDWTAEERQKKLAEFHQKELSRTQKFMAKQKKKRDKHFAKENA